MCAAWKQEHVDTLSVIDNNKHSWRTIHYAWWSHGLEYQQNIAWNKFGVFRRRDPGAI